MYCGERRLLCALLLLGVLATGGRSQPQYVLSTPAKLIGGQTGKACINLVDNKEKLDVNLVLQHNGENTTIIGEDVSSPTYFQCGEYQIPDVTKAVPVTLLLSAKGEKTEILERKTVVISPEKTNCMVQMDKPMYKPKQNVFFRIVCLNSQMKPVNEKFPYVYLMDPARARIKQWRNQETQNGILSFDFQIIDEAPLGSYSIVAERKSTYSLSQWFTVEEYVPPRFSVDVDAPNTVSALQESVDVGVAAQYTYGEPLNGKVIIQYCKQSGMYGRRKNCFREKGDICANMTGRLTDGKFKAPLDMSTRIGWPAMSVEIDIVVVEDDTDIQVKESRYMWVTSAPARLSFDYDAMKQYYKRGIDYNVVAQLTDEQNKPISGQDIDIEVDQKLVKTVTTDSEGRIDHKIDTSEMLSPNFTIKISYPNADQCYYDKWSNSDQYPSAEYTPFRFYSQSGSFLQAKRPKGELSCEQSHDIEVEYSMSEEGVKASAIKVYYMVLSKSKIVATGEQDVDLTKSMKGSLTIPLTVTADMAPSADMLIYCILKGEIVIEKVTLDVEKTFKHKVDMAFSEEKGTPGSPTEVLLTGDPDSICGLRVIDTSLLLLNSYERFSPSGIFGLFSYWSSGYNIGGINVEEKEPECIDPDKLFFYKGFYLSPADSKTDSDSYDNLQEAGVIFATHAQLRKPKVCENNPPPHYGRPEVAPVAEMSLKVAADVALGGASFARSAAPIETIRSNFAETFMWLLLPLNKDGHASVTETAPDTITKWQGSAFCMSAKGGFGMTKYPANYTTFLPFFLELTKPYSIIRGEKMMLVGVVNNYLEHCVKVQVALEPSEDFTAELKEGTQDTCLCPKGRTSFSWEVSANKVGEMKFKASAQTIFIGDTCDGANDDSQSPRRDTVIETIIVEPEGIPQEQTSSHLIFVKPGMKSKLPISITPPENVVPDSISAHVSAMGDMFALSLKNLEDLVQKPYGCGEHNLARMAPAIYALDYLNSTGQLTDEMLEKGKRYIREGYYRQLGFATKEAYKVFRTSERLNSWLTVYSFKVIEQAKKYIEIDENRQQQTLIWMENMQKLESGCFQPEGTLFGFEDTNREVHFTAFLTITLLETEYSMAKTLLQGSLECLKEASKTKQKTADEVLMLLAFTMANLPKYRDMMMEKLMKKAISEGGMIHWEREDMPVMRPVPFFYPPFAPAEVSITAYMLLSMTAKNSKLMCSQSEGTAATPSDGPPVISDSDLGTMAQIAMFLARQQNSHGGYPSTSDTVTTLQALSGFAKLLYTPNSQQTMRIMKGNGDIGTIDLGPENRLVVQRHDLSDPTGDYSIETEGSGWCMIQASSKYNIPIPKEDTAYSLSLSASSENCVSGVATIFNLTVNLSYRGSKNESGMTLLKIRMLSGYQADYFSLKSLENDKIVSKTNQNSKGEVEIYFESVTEDTKTFSFRATMGQRVLNVKTSSAMVYDYYNQGENGYASYNHPCVKKE